MGLPLHAIALESRGASRTFIVNSTLDAPDALAGDGICATSTGTCTLRAAIEEANAVAGVDTITVPAGSYGLRHGELSIADDVIITGAGQGRSIVDGKLRSRCINVSGPVNVTLNGLTVQRGQTHSSDEVGDPCGAGLASPSGATLTLNDVAIDRNQALAGYSDNTPEALGGGLCTRGTAVLTNVRVTRNRATYGGGIYTAGITTITDGSITRNRSTGNKFFNPAAGGGGIENDAQLRLSRVSIRHNRADASLAEGGGIYNLGGQIDGTDIEISHNMAVGHFFGYATYALGGGLQSEYVEPISTSSIKLANVRIEANRAIARDSTGTANGGGIDSEAGHLTLDHFRIVGNRVAGGAEATGGGTIAIGGPNLLSDGLVSRNVVRSFFPESFAVCGGIDARSRINLSGVIVTFNRAVGFFNSNGGLCAEDPTLENVVISNNYP